MENDEYDDETPDFWALPSMSCAECGDEMHLVGKYYGCPNDECSAAYDKDGRYVGRVCFGCEKPVAQHKTHYRGSVFWVCDRCLVKEIQSVEEELAEAQDYLDRLRKLQD